MAEIPRDDGGQDVNIFASPAAAGAAPTEIRTVIEGHAVTVTLPAPDATDEEVTDAGRSE